MVVSDPGGLFSRVALENMLETGLKQWLNGEKEPADFYHLVGLPRLCRDRARLLAAFEEASESLFQFQNHKEKSVRDRARNFHRQVAEARRIVADDARWEKYDAGVVDRLRAQFRKNPAFAGQNPKLDDLRRWLALVQLVDPNRVEELVLVLTKPEPKEKKPKHKPPAVAETISNEAGVTELLPKVRQSVSLSETSIPIAKPAFGSSAEIPTAPAGETSAQRQKREVPPPPPSRGNSPPPRDFAAKSPPPPPRELPPPQLQTRLTGPQRIPTGLDRLYPSSSQGSPVLWIVMAVFLGAMLLGMLGLTIAWASGAFDGKRSRTAISTENENIPLSAFRLDTDLFLGKFPIS